MRIRVVFLGEDPRDPIQLAAADYLARAGRRFDAGLLALKPAKRNQGSEDDRVRLLHSEALISASEGTTRIALDASGTLHASSVEFARDLEVLLARSKPVSFLVGGASGHHPSLLHCVDKTWSLSRLTLAHRLAVLVLAEQLYRAAEIARGGPYHK